jgi:CBS domain containing-hemolysin-like protein
MSLGLLVMLGMSALFSASEAALFSLTTLQRSQLNKVGRSDRAIEDLLSNPSRLLTCILLCNLVINITFFACANVVVSELTKDATWSGWSILFGFASVASVILFGELLPKSVGVMAPVKISRFIALPMWGIMLAVRPISIMMHAINDVFRRLLWPGLVPESVLETTDLERAIELSETNSAMIDLEKGILQNILQLSNIQAPDWMHPKSQFSTIELPASHAQISEWLAEYHDEEKSVAKHNIVLVQSHSDHEVTGTTTVEELARSCEAQVAPAIQSAIYVPWCAGLAGVFQQLLRTDGKLAIVVNERGDSIGVLLIEDIIEAVFASPSVAINTMGRPLFAKTGEAKWEVTGTTRIKQLQRSLGIKLPDTRDATIAGVMQSQLRRIAQVGDQVSWGPFNLQVTDVPRRGEMFVQITSTEFDISLDESGGIE